MDRLDEAYDLCREQRGVLARHQLAAMLGTQVADDLLRSGRFEPMLRGVHRLRGTAELPEQRAFGAALRARPHAVVTGPVALGLYGVPAYLGADTFEILVAPGRSLRNVDFSYRPDGDAVRRGVTTYGGVKVAGPLDALIDSAGLLDGFEERDLRVAWDHLRGKRLASIDRLEGRLAQRRGSSPGVPVLEQVLDRGGGLRVESEGERRLAPVMNCFEPAFEPQVWVTRRRRPDFYSRRCRLACDYLGEVDHAYVAQRIADDERDDELRRERVDVFYVTKRDLEEPEVLLGTLAGRLTVRAHELGVRPPVAVRPLPPSL
ncbi:MAG TPA: hypothetical protein VK906_16085 [Egicoccus sp.]|nr:hypothetical protein [Egicoccus sp.]HSK24706.1 hypothetical protein [Egicoccus sp.]